MTVKELLWAQGLTLGAASLPCVHHRTVHGLFSLQLMREFRVSPADENSEVEPVLHTVMTTDRPLRLRFTPNY